MKSRTHLETQGNSAFRSGPQGPMRPRSWSTAVPRSALSATVVRLVNLKTALADTSILGATREFNPAAARPTPRNCCAAVSRLVLRASLGSVGEFGQ